jgi:hypothetical protein
MLGPLWQQQYSVQALRKGFTVVHNEYNEIIWWGVQQQPDSYNKIREHLVALKEQLDRLGHVVKNIFVDNCCHAADILREIFGPDSQIKLHVFHGLSCAQEFISRMLMHVHINRLSNPERMSSPLWKVLRPWIFQKRIIVLGRQEQDSSVYSCGSHQSRKVDVVILYGSQPGCQRLQDRQQKNSIVYKVFLH